MTGYSFTTPVWDGGTWVTPVVAEVRAAPKVNGPEDAVLGWDAINWPVHEDNVRRLRQRIFKAVQEGDLAKARSLQKLMLRSWSNTLTSVRQATQRNAGRKTAGIDGEVALTSPARMDMAVRVHQTVRSWRPRAVRRVYIPKAGNRAKLRPLGIPVLADRCHQGRVRNALEPEWEARFEPRSYGFRPGRGCQDAIQAIYMTCKGRTAKRVWALDADLAAAFDKIDHSRLLGALGSFPARDMIRDWLKAGVFEKGKGFAPTEEGTPQGGVISPLLLNVALHGLETAAGVRYVTSGRNAGETKAGSPVVIRYADDMVALCHSQEQAREVKARLAEWLAPRGLVFNEDKTKIVSLNEAGFDFLGVNVRRYRGKLLIKPSKAAIGRVKKRLAAEMRALRGSNAQAVLATVVPITRGWSAYYRCVVSRGCSPASTTTCGNSLTSGPPTATRTSRSPGSSAGTTASSTPPGRTTGYSVTVAAAGTWSSSPGRKSGGTCMVKARHLPMTPPWPDTGPNGARRSNPRWTAIPCACSPGRTGYARCAGTTCLTPASHPSPPISGNNGGCTSPARR